MTVLSRLYSHPSIVTGKNNHLFDSSPTTLVRRALSRVSGQRDGTRVWAGTWRWHEKGTRRVSQANRFKSKDKLTKDFSLFPLASWRKTVYLSVHIVLILWIVGNLLSRPEP